MARPPFRPRTENAPPVPRKRMMAQGRKTHFIYDAREILSRTRMDPAHHRPFLETLFARGSRASTEDAKAYVDEKVTETTLTATEAKWLKELVERYSFWR